MNFPIHTVLTLFTRDLQILTFDQHYLPLFTDPKILEGFVQGSLMGPVVPKQIDSAEDLKTLLADVSARGVGHVMINPKGGEKPSDDTKTVEELTAELE